MRPAQQDHYLRRPRVGRRLGRALRAEILAAARKGWSLVYSLNPRCCWPERRRCRRWPRLIGACLRRPFGPPRVVRGGPSSPSSHPGRPCYALFRSSGLLEGYESLSLPCTGDRKRPPCHAVGRFAYGLHPRPTTSPRGLRRNIRLFSCRLRASFVGWHSTAAVFVFVCRVCACVCVYHLPCHCALCPRASFSSRRHHRVCNWFGFGGAWGDIFVCICILAFFLSFVPFV